MEIIEDEIMTMIIKFDDSFYQRRTHPDGFIEWYRARTTSEGDVYCHYLDYSDRMEPIYQKFLKEKRLVKHELSK